MTGVYDLAAALREPTVGSEFVLPSVDIEGLTPTVPGPDQGDEQSRKARSPREVKLRQQSCDRLRADAEAHALIMESTAMLPLKRVCHQGLRGMDVVAYKGGLMHAGVRSTWESRSGLFGHRMQHEVRRFQRAHGLVDDGRIGRHTYAKLYPFLGSYALALLRRYQPPVARTPQQHIADIALWALRFEAQMHYLQQRPMQDMGAPPNVDDYCDCSEFATWVFESAGVPDPNGMGYDGYGSTYSMIGRGERVVGWPEMADLVFYDNPAHVAVGVGVRSGEAMVVSHGSESGPNLTSWRYREPVAVRRYAMAA